MNRRCRSAATASPWNRHHGRAHEPPACLEKVRPKPLPLWLRGGGNLHGAGIIDTPASSREDLSLMKLPPQFTTRRLLPLTYDGKPDWQQDA
jgi:hypothetical protein